MKAKLKLLRGNTTIDLHVDIGADDLTPLTNNLCTIRATRGVALVNSIEYGQVAFWPEEVMLVQLLNDPIPEGLQPNASPAPTPDVVYDPGMPIGELKPAKPVERTRRKAKDKAKAGK